jgi:hypothetical protein
MTRIGLDGLGVFFDGNANLIPSLTSENFHVIRNAGGEHSAEQAFIIATIAALVPFFCGIKCVGLPKIAFGMP